MPQLDAEHREVDIGEVSLHVAERGKGPPLVLLHGWPQNGWMWREVLPALAEEYRVIVPDLRGFGRSEAPPGDYLKRTLAADVLGLLDALGIAHTRLVGHDWGGWIGWLLALEHGERIERFVSLDIPPPWPGRRSPARLARFAAFASYQYTVASPVLGERAMRSPGFVRAMIRRASARKEWRDEELEPYVRQYDDPARAKAAVMMYRTFLTRELPRLALDRYAPHDLRIPTLFLMGERSPLRWALGDPEPVENMRVEVIPRAGHFFAEEAPEEVLELALPFLAEQGAAATAGDAATAARG